MKNESTEKRVELNEQDQMHINIIKSAFPEVKMTIDEDLITKEASFSPAPGHTLKYCWLKKQPQDAIKIVIEKIIMHPDNRHKNVSSIIFSGRMPKRSAGGFRTGFIETLLTNYNQIGIPSYLF